MSSQAMFFAMSLDISDLLLISVCFTLGMTNASIGPSGGFLFATMATILPPAVVVPVHAIVQTGGTVFRFILLRRFVDWKIVLGFVSGGLVGITAGGSLFAWWQPPEDVLRLLLGVSILLTISAQPSPTKPSQNLSNTRAVGGFTSFLSVFVGATGPLVGAWMSRRQTKHSEFLGTFSACMSFQHAAKILVFGALGFSFADLGALITFLLIATTLGSWCGKRLLLRVSGNVLKRIFAAITMLLGGYLIVSSINGSEVVLGSWSGAAMFVLIVILASVLGYRFSLSNLISPKACKF